MFSSTRIFVSESEGGLFYLYIQVPFVSENRREVHIIDHVCAKRLRNIPIISSIRSETESGVNVLSIEIAFKTRPDAKILKFIYDELFVRQISGTEVEHEKTTTSIEVLSNFLNKDSMFPHMFDYQAESIEELVRTYESIADITVSDIDKIHVALKQYPKIIVTNLGVSSDETVVLKKLFNSGTPTQVNANGALGYEGKASWLLDDADLVSIEHVFTVKVEDVIDYEKKVTVFGVLHDVIADTLLEHGLVYDVRLLIQPTWLSSVNFVLSYRTMPSIVEKGEAMIMGLFNKQFMELDPKGRYSASIKAAIANSIDGWAASALERNYNKSWQIAAFGEGSYKTPELVGTVVRKLDLEEISNTYKNMDIASPDMVIHAGERLS